MFLLAFPFPFRFLHNFRPERVRPMLVGAEKIEEEDDSATATIWQGRIKLGRGRQRGGQGQVHTYCRIGRKAPRQGVKERATERFIPLHLNGMHITKMCNARQKRGLLTDSTPLLRPFSISAEGRVAVLCIHGARCRRKIERGRPEGKRREKEEGEGNTLTFLRNIFLATLRSSVNG